MKINKSDMIAIVDNVAIELECATCSMLVNNECSIAHCIQVAKIEEAAFMTMKEQQQEQMYNALHIFEIYHPINMDFNYECKANTAMYIKVADVEAVSQEDAFQKAQNDFNDAYAKNGNRSTSVGDIIREVSTGINYLVLNIGFQEVNDTWLRFTDNEFIELQQEPPEPCYE